MAPELKFEKFSGFKKEGTQICMSKNPSKSPVRDPLLHIPSTGTLRREMLRF